MQVWLAVGPRNAIAAAILPIRTRIFRVAASVAPRRTIPRMPLMFRSWRRGKLRFRLCVSDRAALHFI